MMQLSRRQFLMRSACAGAMVATPAPVLAKTRPTLTIPPLIEVGRGRPIRLDFRPTQTQFEAGKLVEAWGVNGQYLAPTVRVKSNDFVKLTYTNSLPQPLSINIQGLLAPTEMVGSMHRVLDKGSSWSPIVSVNQPACTCWYHADTMLNSALPLYRGLAGLWIIEDEQSRKAKLPNKYGVNDIPLILQDQLINRDGVQVLDSQATKFLGNRLFVNGKENPTLTLPRGWVRLRLLNASLSRRYELRLDNDKPLHLIATGMGMLAAPVELMSLSLAPMERAEILVDLNEGETVSLISGEKRGVLDQIGLLFQDNGELADNVVLEMRPEGLPSALNVTPELPEFDLNDFNLTIAQERKFVLNPVDRLINRQRFDPKRIDVEAKLGSVERWYISTNQAVGFSLQGAKFIVETRNRQKEPHKLLAWQDTVWIERDQEVTILVRFSHQADENLPFSFGVSDFVLRDRGALGQFIVK